MKGREGLFIAIDANIGAGKTNACHAIASAGMAAGQSVRVIEEPTNHPKFPEFLQHYYDDLRSGTDTGGGFAMQIFMLCQRYEQHRLAVELAWGGRGCVVVQDRPIYGDTVFATTAKEVESASQRSTTQQQWNVASLAQRLALSWHEMAAAAMH